jgi:hypothetical protein
VNDRPSKPPNPGSDAALVDGCKCPVLDNGRGWGSRYGEGTYVVRDDCPLHSKRTACDAGKDDKR